METFNQLSEREVLALAIGTSKKTGGCLAGIQAVEAFLVAEPQLHAHDQVVLVRQAMSVRVIGDASGRNGGGSGGI